MSIDTELDRNPPCFAGCHESNRGEFRPIIFEQHGRCYFSHRTFEWPAQAIKFANAAIAEGKAFRSWHSHEMSKEH